MPKTPNSIEALWHLLDDDIRAGLYRQFFRSQWPDLADFLEEHEESMQRLHNSAGLGQAFRQNWRRWRDSALNRLADGEEDYSDH